MEVTMNVRRGMTCQITAFQLSPPPDGGGVVPSHEWMAIATAEVFDSHPDVRGLETAEQVVLTGAAMRVIEGRAGADSQAAVMKAALRALLEQIEARTAKGRVIT
jgi:hypothetical protein